MKDSVNWAEGWSFGIHSPVWWGESQPTTLLRCIKQGRCAWLVSGLQPRRNRPPNQSCRPSAAGHKMQMCHSDTDPQSHEIIPIIDGRDLLIAIVAWSGTGRCDRWGQSPDWIRDKLILASTVTLYVNPFVSLCSNVGITSLPTPPAACLCLNVRMWVRWDVCRCFISQQHKELFSAQRDATKGQFTATKTPPSWRPCWVQMWTETLPWAGIKTADRHAKFWPRVEQALVSTSLGKWEKQWQS